MDSEWIHPGGGLPDDVQKKTEKILSGVTEALEESGSTAIVLIPTGKDKGDLGMTISVPTGLDREMICNIAVLLMVSYELTPHDLTKRVEAISKDIMEHQEKIRKQAELN